MSEVILTNVVLVFYFIPAPKSSLTVVTSQRQILLTHCGRVTQICVF